MENKYLFILHSQYRGCWWPGSLRRQDTSSHGIDQSIPKHSGLNTGSVKCAKNIAAENVANSQQFPEWPSMNSTLHMMTSSNGNIFRVTGPLCGEFTGPGEFPTQRPVTRSFDVFFGLLLNNGWVNNPEAGDLRRHRGHYDVIVMIISHISYTYICVYSFVCIVPISRLCLNNVKSPDRWLCTAE